MSEKKPIKPTQKPQKGVSIKKDSPSPKIGGRVQDEKGTGGTGPKGPNRKDNK